MVQIGHPQCVQLEQLRCHSCRTEVLLKTEQEATWDLHQSCGKWWTGTWPTHGLADARQTIQTIRHCYRDRRVDGRA